MKNILFDLYGTLIDIHTDEECECFWDKLSQKTKKYRVFNGKILRQEYLKLCVELSLEKEEIEILDVFERLFEVDNENAKKIAIIFRKLSTEYIKLYPYVKKALSKLKENGNKLYLLSNAQNAFTIPEMEKLGIYDYFDGIAISSDYGVKKPNHDFFKNAIKEFGLSGEIWMVGNDYECDIKPAIELGIKTVFIKSNLTPRCEYEPTMRGFRYKSIIKILN